MTGLRIGEVAERAGVSTPTIRYYESVGLLKAAPRSSAGYRRYSTRTVEELQFIRKAQALGFSLDEVAEILELSRAGRPPCARVLALTREHLATVDERIRQLQAFRASLAAELERWAARRTAVTRDGLCGFIADAAVDPDVAASRGDHARRPRTRRRARAESASA